MPTRETGFALCITNRGADDPEIRRVYRTVPDKAAAATGYLRVIDGSGEDYLYPGDYFVSVELPPRAKRVWAGTRAKRRSSPNKRLARTGARAACSDR